MLLCLPIIFQSNKKGICFKIDKNIVNEQDVPFHMQKEILPLKYDGLS